MSAAAKATAGGRRRGAWMVAAAAIAALALVAAYAAAGGGGYAPSPVADPCQAREWRDPEGVEEVAEQLALSALDGAACELGVSREALALALAGEESRQRFADRYGIGAGELEAAVRAGLRRAIDDAEQAGAITPGVADPARAVIATLPLEAMIALIADARELLEGAAAILGGGGILGRLGDRPGVG